MRLKRVFCLLLCACLAAVAGYVPVDAAADGCGCGEVVQVFLNGFGSPLYYNFGTPAQEEAGIVRTDDLAFGVGQLLRGAGRSAWERSWSPLAGGIGSLAFSLMGHLQMDAQGRSVEPITSGWALDAAQEHTERPSYDFHFDFRIDPFEAAAQLDDFIEAVCKATGHSKIALTGCSEGAIVAMCYLKEYGTKRLETFILLNGAYQGLTLVGELLTKQFALSGPAAAGFIGNFDDGSGWLKLAMALLREARALDFLRPLGNGVMGTMGDQLYAETLIPLFGQMPILWAFVPASYYPEARKLISGDPAYAALLARADRYHDQVQSQAGKLLKGAKAKGVRVAVIAGYGMKPIPVTRDVSFQCDSMIDTAYASGGATAAPIGETLPLGESKYRSPDGILDAATCILPDQTWFIKNCSHEMGPSRDLRQWIIHSKETPTIASNPDFPQYLIKDSDGRAVPQQPAPGVSITAPAKAAGGRETVIGVLSDIHLYPEELIGEGREALKEGKANGAVPELHSEGVLRSALAALEEQARTNGMKYLLITGDLTDNGEYLGHVKLAEHLLAFEKRSGVQVAVIPGNHDINRGGPKDYSSGTAQQARACTPEEFREIYAQLGYDLADARYRPPSGQQGGGLSYAANLGGFRLLALDTCKYSNDYLAGGGSNDSGMIGENQMAWVLRQLAAAKKAGRPVIGMGHHNLTEHLGYEGGLGSDFMLDGYREAREALADAGMHFYLSGHIHIEEIGRAVSDRGEVIYDISNAALVMFPYTFRVIRFSAGNGTITAGVNTLLVDNALPVTAAGVTYPLPYAKTGFAASFWGADSGLAGFAAEYINRMLGRQLKRIGEMGGIDAYLKETGTADIGASLRDALGDVLAGPLTGLIEDLLAQVDTLYINDPARLEALLENVLGKLFRLQVSKLPCTAFIDSLGFGDSRRAGTLEDFGNSALAYIFGHVGDYTKDAFFMDVIGQIQSGALLDGLLGNAVEILLEDVIGGELLPALRFHPSAVFANQWSKETIGCLLDVVLGAMQGVVSRSSAIALLRCLGWQGLGAVANPVVGLVLPADLKASLNSALAQLIYEMVLMRAPDGDRNSLLVYDGPVKVEIGDNRDFRAPFDITVKRSEDGASAEITWYTKRSVKASDIAITPQPAGLKIAALTEDAVRTVNAIDLGVATVGGEQLKVTKHTAAIDGLVPGEGYSLRVGDAKHGWRSESIALGG